MEHSLRMLMKQAAAKIALQWRIVLIIDFFF